MEEGEKNTFHDIKWWNLKELEETKDKFEPRDNILELLKNLK